MVRQKGIVTLLIVLLIALAVGGYLLYTNYSNNRSKTTITQQSPQPIQTPVVESSDSVKITVQVDPVTGWKTYTDTKYKYAVTFPSDWGNDQCPSGFGGSSSDSTVYICSQEKIGTGSEAINYYIWINKDNSLDQKKTYTKVTINNLTAFRTTDFPSRSGAETVLFKRNDNDYISVSFTPYDQNNPFPEQEKFHQIFNQILSTFKFTQ